MFEMAKKEIGKGLTPRVTRSTVVFASLSAMENSVVMMVVEEVVGSATAV